MDKWSDIWWNDSNEFNKLYCKSSNHVGIPLSQTCRNHFWGLQSWVPNCPISEQKTRDPIGSWILFLGVCPNVHQPSTEESDIWHFCDFKETPRFSCVESVQIPGREQHKKNEKHDTRFTPDLNVLLHLLRRIQTQTDSMWRTFSWHFGVHYGPMAIPTPFSLPFTKPWASIMSQKCGFRFSLVARETKLNFRKGLSHILGPF